jgi:DNA-binding IclR family transcriptional regulator
MATAGQRPLTPSDASSDRNAVVRIVSVIDALARAEPGGIGVRELAIETGISRSAVHRVLAHLAGLGYANLLPQERYEAGPLALAWAQLLAGDHSFKSAVHDALLHVVADFDESAYAFEYSPEKHDLVVASGAQTSQPVRYLLEIGSRAPLHAGAAGKAVLAFLDDSVVDELELPRLTPTTVVDRDRLRDDLATIVERGYALSEGERINDAFGVAAPVFGDVGVAGAITITVPRYRFDKSKVSELAEGVVAAAAAASHLLTA